MSLGMPKINITFTETANTFVERSSRGIVGIIIKEDTDMDVFSVQNEEDIPVSISTENKKQIQYALMGFEKSPKLIIVNVVGVENTITDALNSMLDTKVNYLVVPFIEDDEVKSTVSNFIKTNRASGYTIKAVIPNATVRDSGIINFITNVTTVDGEVTASDYCSRIAGVLATMPISRAATYAVLDDVISCDKLTIAEQDAAVDAGKLIIVNDGEKSKLGRAVNSYEGDSTQLNKIKIIEAMDMIKDDIHTICEDDYIGKAANTYDNKNLLIGSINEYLNALIGKSVITGYSVAIDIAANKAYLLSKNINIAEMSEQELKESQTGDKVYLKASLTLIDAIENIELPITI